MTEPTVPAGTSPAESTVPAATTPPATAPTTPATPPKEVEPGLRTVETSTSDDKIEIPEGADLLDPKVFTDAVNKTVDKRLQSVKSSLTTQQVTSEVSSIIEAHPEYKPFAAKIQKWVTHPNRLNFIKNGFPVESVVLEAIAPHLEEIGAEKARLADDKSRRSGGGTTTTTRPGTATTTQDYKGMSNSQIEELAEKVKSGRA